MPEKDDNKFIRQLGVQIIEVSKSEAFIIFLVDDPPHRRGCMVIDIHKSDKQELLSKIRTMIHQ
jgi:hypothetical protein